MDTACMFPPLAQFGSIDDLKHAVRWDAPTLALEIERRAAFLGQMGIGRGSLVAIAHGGSARFFADLFATWRVGATAACLDGALTDAELSVVVEFARPALLLADRAELPCDLSIPVLRLADVPSGGPAAELEPNADEPALVLFTSGTTGAPKGVVLSFGALAARLALNAKAIGNAVFARTLVTLPTHFGHGLIGNALTPLVAGGEIVLHPIGMPLARDLGQIIDKHDITFMSSVPALWRLALKLAHPPSGRSLARVHVGSAPLSVDLWSDIVNWSRADVVNCYGITETANWIAGASSQADGIVDGSVGRPWGGVAAVVNDGGEIQPAGEGEIVVRSPALTSGYLGRPDLTAAVLRNGWYHTGDRGVVDASGQIRLTGRIKDEINRAGFKVQPAEIDRLLESHPAVAQACAFALTDPVGGEAVAVAVRLVNDGDSNAESLRSWCRERLRREAVPEKWFIVDDIPHNARGKISRDAVRRMLTREMNDDTSERPAG
jgi:acyl-CoA synthetase (AMP-forming)/AMP-acid ligase II